MGDCMRSCNKRSAEKEASSASFSLSKRRKLSVGSRELLQLELASPDITVITSGHCDKCSRRCSGDSSYSPCFSNDSCDSLKFVDLEAKSYETEISTCININKFSRETTPLSELCTGDSEEMESKKTPPHPSTAKEAKTPSQAEIDEFFSVAEKYEQKRFAEKYNYDIVKDMPVDGRYYQWVRLKP